MKYPPPADFETEQKYHDYLNEYERYLFEEEVKRLGADIALLKWLILIISILATGMLILLF